jgi:threonyl-tRNA synthetase
MNEDKINIIRHSCSHLMAQAVRELFPTTKVAIGPAIENGFYYDFDSEHIFTPEDLLKIEEKMNELINKNIPIVKEVWAKQKALEFFKKQGEIYKVELIKDLPDNEVTIYAQGNFVDLCRGPHLASTKEISKAFKLNKIAGAYWRGDSKNKMLQRIYGLCFETKEELKKHLEFLEEAEKRDHRKIGKEMDLFHFEYDYAPGAVFWHHNGFIIYRKMIEYIRKRQEANGYIEVSTPAVMDRSLWETSGHWQKYGAHNYSGKTEDEKVFCIKPMNCPGGVLLYKNTMHSYRDLPMRVAEFGKVHRYEASGALMGLMRVREFTQDDAHIYCTPEQMELETITTLKLILDIYKVFGFDDIEILLSTRPIERIGSDEIWDLCEKSLQKALEKNGYNYKIK